MLDFYQISEKSVKRGVKEIYPEFIINNNSSDLMIRGGDFYAVWMEERGLWSTNEQDLIDMVDYDLDIFANDLRGKTEDVIKVLHMKTSSTGMIDRWHKYCQKQCRDSFHMLDEKLIFSNDKTTKKDYASKSLPYPLEKSPTPGYDKLIGTLYSPEERAKIEWAIGSIIAGDSKKIQKFLVLYGSAGTGKSTILNIIQMLFDGYYSTFDAKALGSASNVFALEAFKTNPLVAIQHDGDLSRIEDNTRLNSLVSHELMTVNEKFKSTYTNRFKSFLFMGTNKPVRITDAKSGLIRRLIDVSPTGNTVPVSEYRKLMKQIEFELGGIAWHCLEVYKSNPGIYDNYIPVTMMGASNDFYNYILECYYDYKDDDSVTLKQAWERYKSYCEEAKVPYPMSQRSFKEELKNYFEDFEERTTLDDGTRVRNYYTNFKTSIFDSKNRKTPESVPKGIIFRKQKSILDSVCKDCPAQYANEKETPSMKWADVTTTLKDLDTSRLHYVKVPQNHIVIDFDLKDESGNKSLERNLIEANKWPPTYAELSKSGQGIHLHYIYLGDLSKVENEYDKNIEIKIFRGKSALRRMLTKCNDLPIATISSGLPLKEEVKKEKKMVNFTDAQFEDGLIKSIKKAMAKEVHPGTKPSIDWIKKMLDDAYESGRSYDVSLLKEPVIDFARGSTNHHDYCLKLVKEMHFTGKNDILPEEAADGSPLVFYDVEVFPNLFLINWKVAGEGRKVIRMINPTPKQVEEITNFKLVGFNCRRYDNHMLYARAFRKYTNEQLYNLSQRIISNDKTAFFGGAWNISYTDVFDFSSKKQSLKKFEIELGIHHKELGLPWDQPVPEEMWTEVAEYCDNDVIATEAVFNARQADFTAREILADVAGMTVNDTTNSLTTKIIFGDNREPQSRFNYRDMGDVKDHESYIFSDLVDTKDEDAKYSIFDSEGRPMFPGYVYDKYKRKSTYRGEEVGEGGYVYSEPGIYGNVALLDIASMHPSSIVAENLFGPYTQRFKDILEARIAIKHKDFDKARKMLDGKLAPYLKDEKMAKDLAGALKIAINSVYGLTAAHFENPFADPRNIDNIVAKRGALFMINLKHEVQKRGFKVAHIKTDSIKIPDATSEIIKFVMDYGKEYGYNFEHEATYDRMCLVNDAVYIAKYDSGEWTATGTQFQVPYVFKTLFSHEPIIFEDMCETKSVSKGAIYLDMNETLPNVELEEKEYEKTLKSLRGKDPDSSECKEGFAYLERLSNKIAKGHNYIFVGRVGNFCPIKEGCGGGVLYRVQDDKYYAVAGTKGYRWLESENVRILGKEDCVDEDYYKELVTEAAQTIIAYGDFEWFISDKPYKKPKYVDGKPVYPDPQPFMNEPEE